MILQALVRHYEDLAAQGKISRPGWSQGKASYALYLDEKGQLLRTVSVQTEQVKGKKTILAPQFMELPATVKRTVGIAANFLCDNSSYIFGIDGKGNPKRALECFAASKALHERLLSGVDSKAAQAVSAFFRTWKPEEAAAHPALQDVYEAVQSGANLVFRYHDIFVHEDPTVQSAWQAYYDEAEDGPRMVCLVTGKEGLVEATHPAIKGVQGAQSSGAALVSFNAPAFCSYGKEQNLNAPTGKYAAFAYTTALNHLLSDREYVSRIGDTTVIYWAEGGDPVYQSAFGMFALGAQSAYTDHDLRGMVRDLLKGQSIQFDKTLLDPNRTFYILGLAPNAARLSVRFFLQDSFGAFLQNVQAHYDRLEIEKPSYDKFDTLPLWKLLGETVNQNARDKSASPGMAGEMLRSILLDARYPATLLNGTILRIRADHMITRGRAAIIKAYYLKNTHQEVPKEVLTVSLNPKCTDPAYTLGRLFSVLEAIQSAANPTINATIKDKYFNAASSTPSRIFPLLVDLAQKHLRKLDTGKKIFFNKQLMELMDILDQEYPTRLSLPQQGSFQLGYYHQTQKRYEKKEENGHV